MRNFFQFKEKNDPEQEQNHMDILMEGTAMTSCHSLKHLVSLSSPVRSSDSSLFTTTPHPPPPPPPPSEKLYFLKFSLVKHLASFGMYSLVTLGTTSANRPLSSTWGSSLGVRKLQLPFRFGLFVEVKYARPKFHLNRHTLIFQLEFEVGTVEVQQIGQQYVASFFSKHLAVPFC
nr:unnamed protein product [Callosobruchus chinensis]